MSSCMQFDSCHGASVVGIDHYMKYFLQSFHAIAGALDTNKCASNSGKRLLFREVDFVRSVSQEHARMS